MLALLMVTALALGVDDPGVPRTGAESPIQPAGASGSDHAEGERRWVRLLAGAVRSSESYTAPGPASALAVEGGITPWKRFPVMARVENRLSRQEYITTQPAIGPPGPATIEVDEQRWDAVLLAGYDLGPSLRSSGGLRLVTFVGAHYLALRNGVLPSDVVGPEVAVGLRLPLGGTLAAIAELGFTYNVSGGKSLSAVGRPVSHLAATAGLGLPIHGPFSLELLYLGDSLVLEHDRRSAHGAAVGVHAAF